MKKEPSHRINIESIAFKKIGDIEQFLNSGVREGTLLEFKKQFPSRLEKSISSMANTYGGLILIGVEETATGGAIVPVKGVALEPGLRERVIAIGLNAIYPPIIPDVRVVEFKSDDALENPDRAVVSIRVDESEEGGHAVDGRTAVYIRADNVSDPIRKATIDELEWFQHKREKAIVRKSGYEKTLNVMRRVFSNGCAKDTALGQRSRREDLHSGLFPHFPVLLLPHRRDCMQRHNAC
jgi:predicted HTH transcriptional regulator